VKPLPIAFIATSLLTGVTTVVYVPSYASIVNEVPTLKYVSRATAVYLIEDPCVLYFSLFCAMKPLPLVFAYENVKMYASSLSIVLNINKKSLV
jgi:hypothetical protein